MNKFCRVVSGEIHPSRYQFSTWVLSRLLFKNSFLATRFTFWLLPILVGMATGSAEAALLGFGLSLIYLTT